MSQSLDDKIIGLDNGVSLINEAGSPLSEEFTRLRHMASRIWRSIDTAKDTLPNPQFIEKAGN